MQAIRSRDTKPELAVRRLLHRAGLRYRVATAPEQSIPRRADIIFTRARVAVFIDGCFWHGCPEHGRREFHSNADYWQNKIAANVTRDADTNYRLRALGWTILRFWEHQDATNIAQQIETVVRARRAGQSTDISSPTPT